MFFISLPELLFSQEVNFFVSLPELLFSQENQVLELFILKFNDAIKCLSIKQEIHFTEKLGNTVF